MIARRAAACLLAGGLVVSSIGWTQTTSALDPAPYEDRLIDGGALAPDGDADGGATYNSEGWPRFFRAEAIASYFDQQGSVTRENGARLFARVDTPNYGALSFDATGRSGPGSVVATLLQRDFAFDEHWRVNNGLGVVSSLGIDLSRTQYRFYIPTFPSIGATTEWLHDRDVLLQASVGQPGNYDGFRLGGFRSLGGTLASAGVEWAFAPQWRAGAQFIDMQDVDSPYATGTANGTVDSRAMYAGLAWNDRNTRLQANLLQSEATIDGDSKRATGVWLDGRTLWQRTTHHYGIFRFDRDLSWGYQPINNDIQGAYYRASYHDLRWHLDGGVDWVDSLSGRGSDGMFYTLNGRYQLDTRTGIGGNLSYLQNAGQSAWQTSIYSDRTWSQGATRLQLSAAHNEYVSSNDAQQVTLDHSWNTPVGSRLSTSLTATRDTTGSVVQGDVTSPRRAFKRYGIGVLGGGDITDNLSVDVNLQYNLVSRSGTARGVYGNVNANWRLSSQWSVVATYYDNRDDTSQLFVIDPLIPAVGTLPIQRTRAVFLLLRYENRAGSPVAALGARPGGALGSIAGTLYVDQNDNGRRDAGEAGIANVMVLLDGRFAVRTDEAGRFEFPFVGVGSHRVSVMPDNVPLPWSILESNVDVRVDARSTATIELGARRFR